MSSIGSLTDDMLVAARELGELSGKKPHSCLKDCPRAVMDTPGLSQSSSEEGSEDSVVKLKRDHDVDPMPIIYSQEVGAIEPTTGIVYPAGLNHYKFIGCGVRTKYYVFHAYTLGLYIEADVKHDDDIRALLLDPVYPKIFRVVMNMTVTSRQYMGAIYEVLTPLMKGRDMDK